MSRPQHSCKSRRLRQRSSMRRRCCLRESVSAESLDVSLCDSPATLRYSEDLQVGTTTTTGGSVGVVPPPPGVAHLRPLTTRSPEQVIGVVEEQVKEKSNLLVHGMHWCSARQRTRRVSCCNDPARRLTAYHTSRHRSQRDISSSMIPCGGSGKYCWREASASGENEGRSARHSPFLGGCSGADARVFVLAALALVLYKT